jgi:single-strand DNA-binding protein
MSGSVNKVILIGRLGKDPEVKYTQSGLAVARFTMATDETRKDASGERQQKTEWHNIVAWDKLAEICGQYLNKGKQVYIEGRIQTRSYEDKESKKRYITEIRADNMVMLGSRGEGSPAEKPSAGSTAQAGGEITDEDIPF